MNFPTYTLETKLGVLTYGYKREFSKWVFRVAKSTLIIPCHGQEQAHKVANLIDGAIKRCGNIDGLARANIDRVVKG